MYSLTTSIDIGQASFKIRNKGDFRMVLDCFEALNDKELTERDRLITSLIIFYEDINNIEDAIGYINIWDELRQGMITFFGCGEENSESNTGGYKLIDWAKDSNLICSAINSMLHQEIRAMDYLHWWTFMSYYSALGECPLSNIVSIRYKIAKGVKLEKHEQKFRQDNPEYFNIDLRSVEQQKADDYIREMWGGE